MKRSTCLRTGECTTHQTGIWSTHWSAHLVAEQQPQDSSHQLEEQTHCQRVHELWPNGWQRGRVIITSKLFELLDQCLFSVVTQKPHIMHQVHLLFLGIVRARLIILKVKLSYTLYFIFPVTLEKFLRSLTVDQEFHCISLCVWEKIWSSALSIPLTTLSRVRLSLRQAKTPMNETTNMRIPRTIRIRDGARNTPCSVL